MQILWFKRDLRTRGHEPLRQALAHAKSLGPVLPLYLHEPSLLAREDTARQHVVFTQECLAELREQLQELGATLLELQGEAVEVFEALWQKKAFSRVWAYQETTTRQAFARDRAVAAWCAGRGVTLSELPQNGVVRARRPSSSWFEEHVRQSVAEKPFEPEPCPQWEQELSRALPAEPAWTLRLSDYGHGADKPLRLRGGRSQALAHLERFLQVGNLLAYPKALSGPLQAPLRCSRLSPYLALGVLSDQEVLFAVNTLVEEVAVQLPAAQVAELHNCARFFVERLYWRSAYLQAFERHCESEVQVDRAPFAGVREQEPWPEALEAWKEGRTGYPYVDAAMRQLAHTGWLNMRLRGTVVSFALNELWLPWREVGLHLAREFLDYEPAIHWNQVQIHAGSSRLSDPLTYKALKQAQDHDPAGAFVRKWVPELESVPLEHLQTPWTMNPAQQMQTQCVLGQNYPAPVVPWEAAHQAARDRVAALRAGRLPAQVLWWKKRQALSNTVEQGSLF